MTTTYWLENPKILFDKQYISEVWPSDDMTYTEKMNTLCRLIIYLTLFGLVFFRKLSILIIGLAILAVFTYLYNKKMLNGDGVDLNNNEEKSNSNNNLSKNKDNKTKEEFTNMKPWKDNEVILEDVAVVNNKNPLNNHLVSDSKGAETKVKKNNKKIVNNNLLIDAVRENSEKMNDINIKNNLENNVVMDRSMITYNKVPDYDNATIKYLIGNSAYVKDSIFKEKKENYIK